MNTNVTHRKRWAGRRGPAPYQQGDLDGLCGVYAIVNAMRALCPVMGRERAVELFAALVDAPPRSGEQGDVSVIYAGVPTPGLRRLIGVARRHMRAEHSADIRCVRLGKRAPRDGQLKRVAWLWSTLTERFDDGGVAIVGLTGRNDHWTVAVAITPRMLWLSDSDGLRAVQRRACERALVIRPDEVFVLTRR